MGWIETTRERFPRLFALDSNWDFSCGDGWRDIVVSLCEHLAALDLPELRIVQVKQKLGGLRVYTRAGNEETSTLIQAAETEAWMTCEECGVPGERPSVQGRLATLCALCHRKQSLLGRPQEQEPTLKSLIAALPPKEAAKALLEARIQILVGEAMATSAIEGVHLDPLEVRRAILIRLGREQGLL